MKATEIIDAVDWRKVKKTKWYKDFQKELDILVKKYGYDLTGRRINYPNRMWH
jgi:hypothetical protein